MALLQVEKEWISACKIQFPMTWTFSNLEFSFTDECDLTEIGRKTI